MTSAWGSSWASPSVWGVSWGSGAAQSQPAADGPGVVLFPHQDVKFNTRGDLAMYALAVYTKHCANDEWRKRQPIFQMRQATYRDAIRL